MVKLPVIGSHGILNRGLYSNSCDCPREHGWAWRRRDNLTHKLLILLVSELDHGTQCEILNVERLLCRYSNATQQVNAIATAALARARRVRVADCDYEALLLTPDRRSVQPEAVPDGIHPSAQAWDVLATACLDADLAELLSTR